MLLVRRGLQRKKMREKTEYWETEETIKDVEIKEDKRWRLSLHLYF